jgi:hypothetical protein
MSENVKLALEKMRVAERQLALSLSRAARSGNPRRYNEVARQIAKAENQMRLLERELQVA